jgi:hypothetical protein
MLLSARLLKDVNGANSFEATDEISWTEGDQLDLYFMLVDASLDLSNQGFYPPGRRYIPAAGAILSVRLDNVDANMQVRRMASQPFPLDGSIWKVSILSSDHIRGTPQMWLNLIEGTRTTSGLVQMGLHVHPGDNLGRNLRNVRPC